jgi:AcrR family transcriptional regulator
MGKTNMSIKEEIIKEGAEGKIVEAAHDVFMEKGYEGTRMREIADKADINKGLLHYYFKSKDKLFGAVFSVAFSKIIGKINEIFDADIPLFEKIERFVHSYISLISKNPTLPRFVINELNRNPELFIEKMNMLKNRPHVNSLISQLKSETEAGNIREIEPNHFLMHMISACLFPFVGKPMFQIILDIDDASYKRIIEERKIEFTTFLINGLRK